MEHIQYINFIINNNKHHLSKVEYKSFNKVINSISKNKKCKKIPYLVLEAFCIILLNTIENIKHNIRDIDYINYMNSLNSVIKVFKYDNNNNNNNNDNNNNNIIIDIDLLLELIEYNKSILDDFIKEHNLSIDFLNSSFNIAEYAAYNYIYDICSYNINNKTWCKDIQKYILNNPLIFIILNESNTNHICNDIIKYNLFSFDGKINSLFNSSINIESDKESVSNIKFIISLLNSDTSKQALIFINIFYIIYTKEYKLLHNKKFRECVYSKILELKECKDYVKYWIDKFNLDSNILDIISDSFHTNFPVDILNL